MQYDYLRGTSLKISRMSLGTMMFGGQTGEAQSMEIMDCAFANGINFFDTANCYENGEGERIVGQWLKDRRDKIVLATKVGAQMGAHPNDAGLSRRNILSAAEKSLKRLETDYIDVYYLHIPDSMCALEETLEAVSGLVKAGKIRYWGVSNYPAWQIADMIAICKENGYVPPCVTQNVYNLITRGIETELLPFLEAHPMSLTVFNPIAGGLLTGKHASGKPADQTRFANSGMYYERYWSDTNFLAVEKLAKIAQESGRSLLELSFQWCAAQESVTSVICGVSKKAQLEQNMEAMLGGALGKDVLAACDRVWDALTGARFGYVRALQNAQVQGGNINEM